MVVDDNVPGPLSPRGGVLVLLSLRVEDNVVGPLGPRGGVLVLLTLGIGNNVFLALVQVPGPT